MSEKRYGHLKLWTAHDLTFAEGACAAHVEVGVVRELARDLIAAQRELARERGEARTQAFVATRSHDNWLKVAEDSRTRIEKLEATVAKINKLSRHSVRSLHENLAYEERAELVVFASELAAALRDDSLAPPSEVT